MTLFVSKTGTSESRQRRFSGLLFLIGFLAFGAIVDAGSPLNFSHLEALTEEMEFKGHHCAIVHVYSHFPNYSWVEAEQSGREGIACVDDVARAAVVYLRHFEISRNPASLRKARLFLQFVLAMQAEDGTFYNFIFPDRSINKTGDTSRAQFGCWSARAVWASGLGCRVFAAQDPLFSRTLSAAVTRTYPHITRLLENFPKIKTEGERAFPTWLVQETGADITSELLLGLCEMYKKKPTLQLREFLEKLGAGVALMQIGDETRFPYGMHLSSGLSTHLWGNCQTQALATINSILRTSPVKQGRTCASKAQKPSPGSKNYVNFSEKEAGGFYSRLLIRGWLKEVSLDPTPRITEFDQIAYGIRPVVVGLIRLYETTKKPIYLKMAGLACGWFFGNNASGKPVYDASTGRCYDAITENGGINLNSGAESTIEALMALVECERYPEISKFQSFRKIHNGQFYDHLFAVYQNQFGQRVVFSAFPRPPFLSISQVRD